MEIRLDCAGEAIGQTPLFGIRRQLEERIVVQREYRNPPFISPSQARDELPVVVKWWATGSESCSDAICHAMAYGWVAFPTVECIKCLFKVLGATSQLLFNPVSVSSSHLAFDGGPE